MYNLYHNLLLLGLVGGLIEAFWKIRFKQGKLQIGIRVPSVVFMLANHRPYSHGPQIRAVNAAYLRPSELRTTHLHSHLNTHAPPSLLQVNKHTTPQTATASTTPAVKMPGQKESPAPKKATIWDDPTFLKSIIVAFYDVASKGGTLNPTTHAAIAQFLNSQGHEVTWEAIR